MDVLVTPDVISFLEIVSVSLHGKTRRQICSLFIFSKDYLAVIIGEELHDPESYDSLEVTTKYDNLQLRLHFDILVKTESKHFVAKYAYENISNNNVKFEKWNSLLTLNHFQQMRKEERLPINSTTITTLKLISAEARIWTHNEQHGCILHDISYSGARLFCTDGFIINSDQKVILQLLFIEPHEIATLRSVIIRIKRIEISGINCNEIAVRFLDPVDLVYLERMSACFKDKLL